jgi:hypothetical protein
MNMHRPLFTPVLLPLVIAMMGAVLWWGGAPASAQTAITASTTRSTSTSSATTTTTTAALVSIKGTVNGLPESVSFSGQAQISANVVTDPDFGAPPTVVLSIDLGKVTGVGSSTGKTYVTSSQGTLNRRLTAADKVQFTFPFFQSGGSAASSRVGMAFFDLSFNVSTLQLTGATAQIVSP